MHYAEKCHLGYKKTLAEVYFHHATIYHVPHILSSGYWVGMCLSILFYFSYYLAQVTSCYECLPRSVVQHFVNLCEVCRLQHPQRNQAPLKPIISSGLMTRGQVCNVTCCLLYNNCYLPGATYYLYINIACYMHVLLSIAQHIS